MCVCVCVSRCPWPFWRKPVELKRWLQALRRTPFERQMATVATATRATRRSAAASAARACGTSSFPVPTPPLGAAGGMPLADVAAEVLLEQREAVPHLLRRELCVYSGNFYLRFLMCQDATNPPRDPENTGRLKKQMNCLDDDE